MPQFNTYPALSVQGPADVALQTQRVKGARTSNALAQAQLQEVQAAPALREQEAAKAKRTESIQLAVNLIDVVLSGKNPAVQQRLWGEAKRRFQAAGFDASKLPETADPEQLREWSAMGKAALNQPAKPPEAAKTVGGMQWDAKTNSYVPIPGYVDQQAKLAKVGAGKNSLTALQKDVPYIAKLLGISEPEAAALKLQSKSKGYAAYLRDITARYVSFGENAERAYEKAKVVADLVYGKTKAPDAEPDSEEGRNWLQKLLGYGGGDEAASSSNALAAPAPATAPTSTSVTVPLPPEQGAPAPRRKPAAAKPDKAPAQMSLKEIKAYVKKHGQSIPQAALQEIDARMTELGVN